MFREKYTIPILVIVAMILLNVYLYSKAMNNFNNIVVFVAMVIGLAKGINASKFKEVFNFHRVKNLFKGPLRKFELATAMLLYIGINHNTFILLDEVSVINIVYELLSFIVFTFILYRFLTLHLYRVNTRT